MRARQWAQHIITTPIAIMGIAVVAIVSGLGASILMSDVHRKQATSATYVRGYAEAIENARRMGALDERHHAGQALLVQFEIEARFAIGQLGLALFIHSLALYAEKGAPGSLAPVFRTCAD